MPTVIVDATIAEEDDGKANLNKARLFSKEKAEAMARGVTLVITK